MSIVSSMTYSNANPNSIISIKDNYLYIPYIEAGMLKIGVCEFFEKCS